MKYDRPEKLGLVGYNTAQGMGYVNRDIVRFLGVDKWLIVQHKRYPALPLMEEADCRICGIKMGSSSVQEWLSGLDVVLFVQRPCLSSLPQMARSMGIKTVCVPMVEEIPLKENWTNHIDLWVAPTSYSHRRLSELGVKGKLACSLWPIDTSALTFKQRRECKRYVFAHGNGGPRDRKGGKIVAEAARLAPEIPLTVYSQARRRVHGRKWLYIDWPDTVDFRGPAEAPSDIYRDGDVFLLPSRWEGLGLQLFECQAAGMPLITTDGPPMNEAKPWRFLPRTEGKYNLGYDFTSHNVAPAALARLMRESLGADITEASRAARAWVVQNRDWASRAESIRSLILDGVK